MPSGTNTNKITLNWTAVAGATQYKIYRGTASGEEQLLATTVGAVLTYTDDTNATPTGAMPTTSASSGIAVAVGVNVVDVTTRAYLARNAVLTGSTVTVESLAPAASNFLAQSTSGAGGSSVGVAGSIAINIVFSGTSASIETPAPVAVNGDLVLTATSNLDNKALALAKQSAEGDASGIGASFALNVVNDTTSAGIADNATLTGVDDLTLTATATDTMTTTAEGGASAGSGSLALSAQAAISISNVTTSASIGIGSPLTIGGALNATATQNAKATTKALGNTKGGSASIGLSLALAVANHLVDSQLERDLTAGGAVSFTADGSSSNETEAVASAAGAKGKSGDGAESKDSSGKDVNEKANDNLGRGNTASDSTPAARARARRARRRPRAARATAAPR